MFVIALILGGAVYAETPSVADSQSKITKSPTKEKPAQVKKEATQEGTSTRAIAGKFGDWALVCEKAESKAQACSLVQSLVERESKKLVFRLTLNYGPKGKLVMAVGAPIGILLPRGLEVSLDGQKIYRLPFQTCGRQACRALLVIADDAREELLKAKSGTIAVYSLSGQALRAQASLAGFADGLQALDKRRAQP